MRASAAPQALIISNATIYTLDRANPVAEALALRNGRILAVGTRAQVESAVGDAAQLDLHGATVIVRTPAALVRFMCTGSVSRR